MSLYEPPFNFMRLPEEYTDFDKSLFVILPVGYDATTSYLPGTRKGPWAIIESSINLEWYDMEMDNEAYLSGIHTKNHLNINAHSPELMYKNILKASQDIVKENKFLIGIGGEHSVSLGFIEACQEKYKDITLIHFDAHADVRESYEGTPFSHASVIKNVYNKGIKNIIQVGIRSMDIEEKEFLDNSSIVTIDAYQVHENLEKSIKKICDNIKKENVYITFDIDAFDTSVIWDTGTPEPGGLLWYDTLKILRNIFEKSNVIGFDVVELIGKEPSNASTAAKLIYKMMGYKIGKKNSGNK